MNVGKRLVSLLGATLFILITSASIQAQTFTISGRVSDPPSGTGVGIERVTLTLTLNDTTQLTRVTGSDGNYSFEGIAAGSKFELVASKPGLVFNPVMYNGENLGSNVTGHFTFSRLSNSSIQFASNSYEVDEGDQVVEVIVTRTTDAAGTVTVDYTTADSAGDSNCNTLGAHASSRCDYGFTVGRLRFNPNELQKSILIPIIDDSYQENDEDFRVELSNVVGGTIGGPTVITIKDNETGMDGPNPIGEAEFFVRQHYIDFLNRQPDAPGLAFWTNEITSCDEDENCVEVKRINVSAAFFLSIEFQQTGYLVYRIHKAAFGNLVDNGNEAPVPIDLNLFLPDTQAIGRGVVVGQGNWEQQLDDNKNAFVAEFVTRQAFTTAHPNSLTAEEFVNELFENAEVVPTDQVRQEAIAEFSGGAGGSSADNAARARALRRVAENATLEQQEFNNAFVLMQYFGYLRRSPNSAPDMDYGGYNFWLNKLNQFNGNFVDAEMVKAFIVAGEFRERFGP